MRRFYNAILTVGLVGAGLVLLAGCAAQKGPLSPNTGLINSSSVASGYPKVTSFSWTGGGAEQVSQTAQVVFDRNMNAATFNQSTVTIYKLDTTGLSETVYTNYVLQYEAQLRTLFIKPDPAHNSGFWDDNSRYRVTLSPSITSTSGAQLDGNKNGVAESAVFDTFHATFSTGTPSAPAYVNIGAGGALQSLKLNNINPINVDYYTADAFGNTTETTGGDLYSGNIGGIAAGLPVMVTVTFSTRLDIGTAWVDSTHLASAFSITDSTGNPVAPTSVSLTANNTALFVTFMSGFTANTRFQVSIKGGVAGLRSSNENNLTLMRYLHFSGKGHDYASASDDTPTRYLFTTAGAFANPDKSTPPTILSKDLTQIKWESTGGPNGRFTIPFTTTSGNGKMDASTLNTSTLKLFTGSSTSFDLVNAITAMTPKDIVYDLASNTVYVYMPDDFISPISGQSNIYVKLFISHNVRSADGLYFDGNGDGVATQDYNDDVFTGDGNNSGDAVQIQNKIGSF